MSIFEDTNPRALKDLLVEAYSHTMALPDFQRDFVWEPGATQELIVPTGTPIQTCNSLIIKQKLLPTLILGSGRAKHSPVKGLDQK